ncbi:(d)CMP kinase [Kosmotoga olearia]|uniref:Cytidylate kinase n=1 Tax=Kosmotoga olearia (strain ATCC BAA-1733 / DSM 21960 / TBF 19.5.1) TaxID=521045 RepID=C5CIU8_KOSOT|nr:(d)CMP kinase [Kosmotoga olearia]ACR78937.1 cytidylate kinase [Kosmotoga olearia TBF 19.5.1]
MKIAIDGPAGSGKSTVAKMLAERLGFTYVDTGAMYRAVAWKLKQHDIDPDNTDALRELLENTQFSISDSVLCMDGRKIGDEIRTPEISRLSSDVAKIAEVRHFLTAEQRRIAEKGNVIMEGRDIGTVVIPDADLKFFITASPEERARRRYEQLKRLGIEANYDRILNELIQRDRNDSSREIAPLKPAKDAIIIDTTNMTIDEVLDLLVRKVRDKGT